MSDAKNIVDVGDIADVAKNFLAIFYNESVTTVPSWRTFFMSWLSVVDDILLWAASFSLRHR